MRVIFSVMSASLTSVVAARTAIPPQASLPNNLSGGAPPRRHRMAERGGAVSCSVCGRTFVVAEGRLMTTAATASPG